MQNQIKKALGSIEGFERRFHKVKKTTFLW